jgi:hypothetical protein
MAPNHNKQSLLPLGTFIKNPKKDTVTKHKLLAIGCDMPTTKRSKPFVDKRKAARIAEEKRIAIGAEGWRYFLEQRRFENFEERFEFDIMFQVYGDAPDPHTLYDDDDEHLPDELKRHGEDNDEME